MVADTVRGIKEYQGSGLMKIVPNGALTRQLKRETLQHVAQRGFPQTVLRCIDARVEFMLQPS
jgi:hypothetical protein